MQSPVSLQPDAAHFTFSLISSLFPDKLAFKSSSLSLCITGLYHYTRCLEMSAHFLLSHNGIYVCLCMWLAVWCGHQNKVPALPAWILSRSEDSAPTYRRAINNWHMILSRGPDIIVSGGMTDAPALNYVTLTLVHFSPLNYYPTNICVNMQYVVISSNLPNPSVISWINSLICSHLLLWNLTILFIRWL